MKRLGSDTAAGAITAIVAITYSLSYGALIFSGPLAPDLALGIGAMLATAAASGIVVALTSSFRFAIAGPDSNATAVLAIVAAGITETMPSDPVTAAHTVLLALMLSALAGGALLLALGQYRLGRWIRFIPYPIVAGFLAATGWLLLSGALRVVADVSLPYAFASLRAPIGIERLATGIAIAALLYATRRSRNPLLLPGLLVAASIVVTGTLAATGSLAAAHGNGWLVPAIGRPAFTSVLAPAAFRGVDWRAIGDTVPAMATAMTVTVIAILFGAAGLEAQTGVEADLDRELRSSGFASIASALCGGSLGSLSSSRSIINRQAGAQTRLAGVLVGLASAAVLAGGSSIVAFVPRPVLGGLLLYLGGSLLAEWIAKAWRHLGRGDFLLVVTIVTVTAMSSFLAALVIGLIFSCVSFVIRYGRFRAVRHDLTGANKRSRVERSATQRAALERHGRTIRVLMLHGYIFFGTANAVLEKARTYVDAPNGERARYLIVDFGSVSGLDSSAANSFATLAALGARHGVHVIYCGLSELAYAVMIRAAEVPVTADQTNVFTDLDHALEWCEDDLLARVDAGGGESTRDWFAREFGDAASADTFLSYFDVVRVAPYAMLFRRGDPSDALFVVEAGRLNVTIRDEAGNERRLRSMVAGSFVGEMGVFTDEPRSADVTAEDEATLYRLTRAALERMSDEQPRVAGAFHALLFRLQAERIRFANAEIAALEA